MNRFFRITGAILLAAMLLGAAPSWAAGPDSRPQVLHNWYRMILELVRHTPTYTPPVASRAFAYTGLIAYEATASGSDSLGSLVGQLDGLPAMPPREAATYDDAIVLQAAMTRAVTVFFSNTGPTGQRAKQAMTEALNAQVTKDVPADVVTRSMGLGTAIADTVIAWSETDGGAVVENMGFPMDYTLGGEPQDWVPTTPISLQQPPLRHQRGSLRPFPPPDNHACALPPPPAYSEDPASAFYAEAKEVYDTSKSLTDEQKLIARFWSDDPMLSPTPPGHWISSVMQIAERDNLPIEARVDALVRLGMGVADGFIVNWRDKYRYDLLRPLTYIRRVIDPKWEALLNTPPFPEYPSGHSTQSGAAATVLEHVFGENFAFDDSTHADDGLPIRSFPSFRAAADEAGMSRLYGGIHFRAAIDKGLDQGDCVGEFVNKLRTWK